jgi:hypothetical protein
LQISEILVTQSYNQQKIMERKNNLFWQISASLTQPEKLGYVCCPTIQKNEELGYKLQD